MSTANISYGSLRDASSEARSVAKKLDKYADNLNSSIYRKLCDYSGDHTSNISSAQGLTNAKMGELRDKSAAYFRYAEDLSDLREKCVSTDTAVKSMVSRLTASFKATNGIKNSKVQNIVNYFLTSIGNSSTVGRWLGNASDKVVTVKDYVKQSIKEWWNYEGGKQLAKGVLKGVLEGVLAVCAIVGAIFSGGALIFIIAGVVAGVIALANSVANIWNEVAAYRTTRNGDPATGRRRSDINTWQDYMRSSFVYSDDGEKYEYNSTLYNIANGIDTVNFVCTVINFVGSAKELINGAKDLVKNAYKWTTGSMANIKNLRVRDILTKSNLTAFWGKVKSNLSIGKKEILTAFRSGNFDKIKGALLNFGDDFLNNLKGTFTLKIFENDKKFTQYLKHGAKLVKTYAGIGKTLLEDGLTWKSLVVDIGINKITLPHIDMVEIITYNHSRGGIFDYDISAIKLVDVTNLFKDTKELFGDIKDIFKDGKNIFEKLTKKCDIKINVPEILIPEFRYEPLWVNLTA